MMCLIMAIDAGLPETAIGAPHQELEAVSARLNTLVMRVTTAVLLSGGSFDAFEAQRHGYSKNLPQPLEAVAESCAHPALGYIGAGIGVVLAERMPSKPRKSMAALGATAANFTTEGIQSVLIGSHETAAIFAQRNLPENGKDFVFALLGAGLYGLQTRRARRRQATACE